VTVPVAADEGFCSPRDAVKLIRADAADIFSIKTTKMGGLLPSFKAAAVITAAGRKVFVNSMIEMGVSTMSSLNLAVATPSLFACGHAINSVRRLKDDILKTPVPYARHQITAPVDRIGLGADLDEEKMKAYCVGEFSLP
jgi:muconate cycloisomerase